MRASTINKDWKKLLPKKFVQVATVPSYKSCVQELLCISKNNLGECFQDARNSNFLELIRSDIEEMVIE